MASLKVILSADSIRFPLTGVGRYTYELARHLEGMPGLEPLRFHREGRVVSRLPAPPAVLPGDASRAPPLRARSWRAVAAGLPFAMASWRLASGVLARAALRPWRDWLYHGTGFYVPAFDGRSVSTIHDLSVFRFPEFHPRARVRWLRGEIAVALDRCSRVITVSEFTRRELMEVFGVPGERIEAVPLAAGPEFHPRAACVLQAFRARHALPDHGYVLCVGTLEPRKNLQVLLDAYTGLPDAVRRHWPLVLAGFAGWGNERLQERLDRAKAEGWLRYLGYLPAAELPLAYAGARLFVFPSCYEGFGLPVLEAMASGVPVACASGSSLDEVAAGSAARFQPADVETLSQHLRRGLEDEAWCAGARQAGLEQAARFSWQRCAEATVAVYARA